ncbi:nucleotide exchange factor GrpE [Actinosynnema sp. NPDC023587]|uniref:nucleotide exchange factor GrpE n=1 Tax=Actinosynnema sp. NPDC023587 TaxID=3154695 RepID=UPI0033EDEE59
MTQPEEQPHAVVRDDHRIDPETGEVRPPAEEGAPAPASDETGPVGGGGEHAVFEAEVVEPGVVEPGVVDPGAAGTDPAVELKAQLDERTADLQRLTAEYANYRKRVERDREVVVSTAKAGVAGELLGVLDDIERAGAHGDLTGAFKAVADKLVSALGGTGLEPFGHEGEPFDPSVHEAVQHGTSPDVTGPTVTAVLRRGYRFGERVLRPALVAVTDYEASGDAPAAESQQD